MNATIQAQIEYKSKFASRQYNIQIVDGDEAAQNLTRKLNVTPEGAVISYESADSDIYQPIISSTCQFTVICQTEAEVNFLKSIATATIGRYGVRILTNNSGLTPVVATWVGVVVADQMQFADNLPQAVTITATDDLGYLADAPYLQSDGTKYTGEETLITHLRNAFEKLRNQWYWQYFISIFGNDFYNVQIASANDMQPSDYVDGGANLDLLGETKVNHFAFYDEKDADGVKSCYYVVEQICRFFNVNLFMTHNFLGPRFILMPVGSYQDFAINSNLPTGTTYRSDGAVANNYVQPNLIQQDITNDASNKRRLAGGIFGYLQPYSEVKRSVSKFNNPYIINKTWSDGGNFGASEDYGTQLTLSEQQWEENDRFRIVGNTQLFWNGTSSTPQVLWSESGNSGTAPQNWGIGRVRIKVELLIDPETGNDYYLRRNLTAGGQVPIYSSFGNFTSTPQYYTNLFVEDNVTWNNGGSAYAYVVVSEPYDVEQQQFINIPIDFITPEVPEDATQIKIKCTIEQLAPDNTEIVNTVTTESSVFDYSNPYTNIKVYPFDGFGSNTDIETYTASNDEAARQTLNSGELFLGDAAGNFSYGVLNYRKTDGTYSPSVGTYQSALDITGTFPAAKFAAKEILNFYSRHRETYSGTIIKRQLELFNTLLIDSTKFKIQSLTYATGIEEAQIIAVELARNDVATVAFEDAIELGNEPIPSPTVNTSQYDITRGVESNTSIEVAPIVDLTSDATARDRSSQTGEVVATIDANGVMQEIADGSNGQILGTNGSGVYAFRTEVTSYVLASHSARAVMYYQDRYYYGSTLFGWDTDGSFSSSQTINTSINDQFAHNGIVVPAAFNNISLRATVRNDSFAGDVEISICKGSRPNGSTANITLTELGTATASCSSGIDLHYNADFDASVTVAEGDLIFVFLKRLAGGSGTDYINFSYTVYAINR